MADLPQTILKMTKRIKVTIIQYPNAMESAIYGLKDLLTLANKISSEQDIESLFATKIMKAEDVNGVDMADIFILPPSLDGEYHETPGNNLLSAILSNHQNGAVICSACAGAFILARTGLLDNRTVTTHWQLKEKFELEFPKVSLNIESLLINDGDIVTAGGLMSWIDLGLEIVAQYTKPSIMRALGKFLIVDTGRREQKYYVSFSPKLNHGNKAILKVQHFIQTNFEQPINIAMLADKAYMSERTFFRQFTEATKIKPTLYVQKIRVQKACELLETTSRSFEQISSTVGYDDVNSFRKVFIKLMGLSPSAFRARFS